MNSLLRFKQAYFDECGQLLAGLKDGIDSLDDDVANDGGATRTDILIRASRAAHSIKGGAGAFGLVEIEATAAALEADLDLMLDLGPTSLDETTRAELRDACADLDKLLQSSQLEAVPFADQDTESAVPCDPLPPPLRAHKPSPEVLGVDCADKVEASCSTSCPPSCPAPRLPPRLPPRNFDSTGPSLDSQWLQSGLDRPTLWDIVWKAMHSLWLQLSAPKVGRPNIVTIKNASPKNARIRKKSNDDDDWLLGL